MFRNYFQVSNLIQRFQVKETKKCNLMEIVNSNQIEIMEIESGNLNNRLEQKPFSTRLLYWFLLFISITFYGVGIFVVYIPDEIMTNLDQVPQNSWFIISISRFISIGLLLLMTTKYVERSQLVTWIYTDEYRTSIRTSLLSTSLNVLGYLTYERLILRGNSLGLMSVITDSFVLIPVVYGIFVFKDKMNWFKRIGFPIFAAGVIFIGMGKFKESKTINSEIETEIKVGFEPLDILLIIVTMGSWATATIFQITSLKKIPYSFFLYILLAGQFINVLIGTVWVLIDEYVFNLESIIVFTGYFMTTIANVAGIYLSADDHTAKWNALIHLNILITLGLSMAFFGERLNAWLYAGIGTLIGSSLLISI